MPCWYLRIFCRPKIPLPACVVCMMIAKVKGAQHNDIETAYFQEYCQRLQDFVWSLDPKWKLKPGTVFSL